MDARDPLIGATLGPYRVERQIGRGGMATVYEARHLKLDRTVALKLLLPSFAADTECVERFLTEARAAARLDHPHIVPVYDCGEIDGVNYIAMKLLEGRDLKSMLRDERQIGLGRLPLARTSHLVSQVASALTYAHQHGVVHRDVKPANIYVDGHDWVTLVDFGIAWALDNASTTVAGAVIGTPAYMSPDQARGGRPDQRSDIYSLGVVLYEMLTGVPPFSGDQQTIMYAHVNTPPPRLGAARPDLPKGVSAVVERALAKRPEDRFQGAEELASALREASGRREAGGATAASVLNDADTLTAPAVRTDRRPRLSVRRIAAVAAVVVAGLVLVWIAGSRIPRAGGRMSVESDPPGATVTVDGVVLGTTPLSARALSAGMHEVVLEKPTYGQVRRREQVRPGQTEALTTTLPAAAAFDLLQVETATVATGVSQDAGGRILAADEVDSVGSNDPFALILSVAQKQPGYRDISFRCQVAVFSPSGTRLAGSDPVTITIPKDDAGEHSCAGRVNLPASAVAGTYQAKFFVDGMEAAPPRPIALVK